MTIEVAQKAEPASSAHRPAFCLTCAAWTAIACDAYAITPTGVQHRGWVQHCPSCRTDITVETP